MFHFGYLLNQTRRDDFDRDDLGTKLLFFYKDKKR
jgi:hypothetical protein